MRYWLYAAAGWCGFAAPVQSAVVEGVYTDPQGLLVPVSGDLPTLPEALFDVSGGTVEVRLNLKNDGSPVPGVFVLPVFVGHIGTDPWVEVTSSIYSADPAPAEPVSFFLPPAVTPFTDVALDPLTNTARASTGVVLPGGSVFAAFFLNIADNGGPVGSTFEATLAITVPEPGVAVSLGMLGIAAMGYRFRNQTGSPLSTSAT